MAERRRLISQDPYGLSCAALFPGSRKFLDLAPLQSFSSSLFDRLSSSKSPLASIGRLDAERDRQREARAQFPAACMNSDDLLRSSKWPLKSIDTVSGFTVNALARDERQRRLCHPTLSALGARRSVCDPRALTGIYPPPATHRKSRQGCRCR